MTYGIMINTCCQDNKSAISQTLDYRRIFASHRLNKLSTDSIVKIIISPGTTTGDEFQ